jgi:hypothetical protein
MFIYEKEKNQNIWGNYFDIPVWWLRVSNIIENELKILKKESDNANSQR